jgi:hypothetical protein
MAPNVPRRLTLTFLNLAKAGITQVLALTTALCLISLFLGMSTVAQQTTPPPDAAGAAQVASNNALVAVPAGTRIALILTQPIQTRLIHRGDDIYAQIVSPVTAGNDVVIPAGTFVQGKVDKIERQGGRGQVRLQSMAITFPDGYTIPIAGPITLSSPDGYALKDPGPGRTAGMFALPAAGLGIGALIGHATANSNPSTITNTLPPGCTGPPPGCLSSSVTAPGSTAKGTIIGAMVGGAIGGIASFALILNTHNFFLDVGTPAEMILQHPLSLAPDEVADAVRDAQQHPGPAQPIAQSPEPLPDSGNGVSLPPVATPAPQ